jgi:exodeoxyribonuclease V beta subunit
MATDDTPPFNVYAAPLAGLNLVEASAGTGKTWTISGLYTRLILELGLGVDQILVVTYTKAATAELRDRIRKRLRSVQVALEDGGGEDEFCRRMLELSGGREELARNRLIRAIGGFDQAAVFTIHGFCQRLLSESAFESGSDFDCEVLPDEKELLGEIVDDFWRQEVYTASAAWAAFLAEKKQSPEVWLNEVAGYVGKPFLKVLGAGEPADGPVLEARLKTEVGHAAWVWHTHKHDIDRLLTGFDGFHGSKVKPAKLRSWLDGLDGFFGRWPMAADVNVARMERGEIRDGKLHGSYEIDPGPLYNLPEGFSNLGTAALAAALRKNRTAPEHPFFDRCQTLAELDEALRAAFEARLKALKPRLLDYCNAELEKRKARARVFSYNDMLNRLATALEGEQGGRLADTVRRRYRAALIDEFQDTDPMQYRIFRRVYGDGGLPVFFVGDPKQAIYGFRGADVFSYLEARGEEQIRRGTLTHNQRSEPALITAVNALFLSRPRPFLLDAIPYPEVEPAGRERPALSLEGGGSEPLRFLLLPPGSGRNSDGEGGESALGKGAASDIAAEATAFEIARLLQEGADGKARLGDRPLHGGDIAVLVSTHAQARQVEEALRARGVPGVRQGQDNVFESPEALELERVLLAIAEPGREPLLKAALATELMGFTANAIHDLQKDEPAWERMLDRFQGYHQLWLSEGFMPMFRRWFESSKATENLPEFRDGERRLTNLLHLAELLQVESRRKSGIDTLLTWFAHAIRQPSKAGEEAQLRLESDARRVKIVTIHTSKGLEYPIVFCPFLWDGRLSQRKVMGLLFHDGCQAVLDLGSPEQEANRRRAVLEEMSEKLRLLYVALTRAVYRCYVVWGNVRNARDKGEGLHTAALAWLLHGGAGTDGAADPLAALAGHLQNAGHGLIEAELRAFAARVPGCVSVAPTETGNHRYQRPGTESPPELAVRSFRRQALWPSWRMSSFTGLTTGRHSEAPDYDLSFEPEPAEDAGDSIFAFPRGARAGSCLHAILEDWDFTCPDIDRLGDLVRRKLKAHGIDERWTATVRLGLETLLAAPLNKAGLKLGDIPPNRRLVELEFTFALKGGDAQNLRSLLSDPDHGCDPRFAEAARLLGFRHIAGYMKGFIDLVFEAGGRYYLADYKSNWLGNKHSDYAPDHLAAAMAREHYYLQYLIYTVALHRYLKLRLPDYDFETHYGGVYYLFLRGIEPRKKTGIFWDRPRLELVEGLERMMGWPRVGCHESTVIEG